MSTYPDYIRYSDLTADEQEEVDDRGTVLRADGSTYKLWQRDLHGEATDTARTAFAPSRERSSACRGNRIGLAAPSTASLAASAQCGGAAMISRELLRECEGLGQVIAPELWSAPVYLINRPATFDVSDDTVAFATGGNFDLRDALIADNRWRGPGAMIVFCHDNPREKLWGTTCHELAHRLPVATFGPDVPPTPLDREREHANAEKFSVEECYNGEQNRPGWWLHHGMAFVRTAIHLHTRAWSAGFEVPLPAVHCAGRGYDLSEAWKYKSALGDEPRRMLTASFSEILSIKAPEDFIELFHDDCRRWGRQRKETQRVCVA